MSEENKARELPNPDIFGPPFFGVGLGEKLGSIDARVIRLEIDMAEVKHDLKTLTSKVDKMDERLTNRMTALEERLTDRMTALDERLTDRMTALEERLTDRMTVMDGRMAVMDGRMAAMDSRMAGMDSRLTALDKKLDDNAKLLWGLFVALLAAIIVQKFI